MPALVLFDLDGTLLDGGGLPGAMRATCESLATHLPGVDAAALIAANTAVWQQMWPDVEDDYMLGGRTGDDVGREAWRRTLAACGIPDAGTLDRAVATWAREERASLRLHRDALPALAALEGTGTRVGMVTNGAGTVQRDKLEALGIADRFDPLVISGEVGVRKPGPEIFEIALARAGVPPAETRYVGDNLRHDIPGARAAGIRTVWIDRRGVDLEPGWPQPDEVVRSLIELVPG